MGLLLTWIQEKHIKQTTLVTGIVGSSLAVPPKCEMEMHNTKSQEPRQIKGEKDKGRQWMIYPDEMENCLEGIRDLSSRIRVNSKFL